MPLKITRVQEKPIQIRVGTVIVTVVPIPGKGARDRITITSSDPVTILLDGFGGLSEPDADEARPKRTGPLGRLRAHQAATRRNPALRQHFPDCVELPGDR